MTPQQSHELDVLFDNGPSSIRNSMLIFILRILAWSLGILCFSLGISFIADGTREWINANFEGLPDWFGGTSITRAKGIFLILLSFCQFLIVVLCNMILRRNKFSLHLFAWHENLKKEKEQ